MSGSTMICGECGVHVPSATRSTHDAWHIGQRRWRADVAELLDVLVESVDALRQVQEIDSAILDAHLRGEPVGT